jgi:hypothetical protein
MALATRPASQKQMAFLWKLVGERTPLAWMDADGEWAADLGMTHASDIIAAMMNQPRLPLAHDDGNAVGVGYYFLEGLVYQVVESKAGNLYGKVFTDSGYEYQPGAMRLLAGAHRLTLDQAAEMGVKTGRCVVCARLLTDPESVAAGIGPVCRAAF